MAEPRAMVLRAAGINCDMETAHAFERAGAEVERVHVNRLLERPSLPVVSATAMTSPLARSSPSNSATH